MGVDKEAMLYPPRTTRIVADPRNHDVIWASTEVNGLYRSNNGGEDWEKLPDIGPSMWHQDNHCLVIQNGDVGAVYVTGPEGLATSHNNGESWERQSLPTLPGFRWQCISNWLSCARPCLLSRNADQGR